MLILYSARAPKIVSNLDDEAENGDSSDCFALKSFLQVFINGSEIKGIKDWKSQERGPQHPEYGAKSETPYCQTSFENLRAKEDNQ